MNFKEVLNKYLKELNCSQKMLSESSGLSETVISRYKSGERTPVKNSEQLTKLTTAIFNISKTMSKKQYTLDKIENDFNKVLQNDNFDYTTLSNNLNILITSLKISINEMSKYIVFDSSHISRIRYGKAKPSNPIEFSNKICTYIFNRYNNPDDINNLMTIIGCKKNDLSNNNFHNTLFTWLTSESIQVKNQINDFLYNLDSFNLNDYIKAIKFDELKVPSIPFYKAKSRHYYGIEEMKEGELNFFKATVLSKSKEDIFMCSHMPMEDMAEDVSFGKKWMFAIAMCLKKGHHLNIIHNLDRPFNEMMLGLESWIPIYMTGQVSPYYFKEIKNTVYQHINYSSGSVILTGECIKNNHSKGKYYIATNLKELDYYKVKCRLILKKASSLMDIYKVENKDQYKKFLSNSVNEKKNRKRIYSSLPLFTISDKLLVSILKRNNINSDDINKILDYKHFEEKYTDELLKTNIINDVIYNVSKDNFKDNNVYLTLSNSFFDKRISYSYNEFLEHYNSTINYKNKNYIITQSKEKNFDNIDITIVDEDYVILSKSANPIIHFVIRHNKLVKAIECYNPVVVMK